MKKKLFFFAAHFLIVACSRPDKTSPLPNIVADISLSEFPAYDEGLYGLSKTMETGEVTLRHQNCCECQTSACSAKKCCSGTNGANCSCTCTTTWYGSHSCNCGPCTTIQEVSYELWLTEEQFDVYLEFNNILVDDGSFEALLAREQLIGVLNAIKQNDFDEFYNRRVLMGSYLRALSPDTKVLINSFLDKHGFEDERL